MGVSFHFPQAMNDAPLLDRMPKRETYGHERLTTIDHLLYNHRKVKEGEIVTMTNLPRQILGYGLPSWQRGEVWSDDQSVRFIESIWQGRPLGAWMVNTIETDVPHALDGLLLDGQQRLRAIERYFNDEIAIENVTGSALCWSDLKTVERRRFGRTVFAHLEVNIADEAKLQHIYDTHNFGGVAHQDHEHAVGAPLDTARARRPRAS